MAAWSKRAKTQERRTPPALPQSQAGQSPIRQLMSSEEAKQLEAAVVSRMNPEQAARMEAEGVSRARLVRAALLDAGLPFSNRHSGFFTGSRSPRLGA